MRQWRWAFLALSPGWLLSPVGCWTVPLPSRGTTRRSAAVPPLAATGSDRATPAADGDALGDDSVVVLRPLGLGDYGGVRALFLAEEKRWRPSDGSSPGTEHTPNTHTPNIHTRYTPITHSNHTPTTRQPHTNHTRNANHTPNIH